MPSITLSSQPRPPAGGMRTQVVAAASDCELATTRLRQRRGALSSRGTARFCKGRRADALIIITAWPSPTVHCVCANEVAIPSSAIRSAAGHAARALSGPNPIRMTSGAGDPRVDDDPLPSIGQVVIGSIHTNTVSTTVPASSRAPIVAPDPIRLARTSAPIDMTASAVTVRNCQLKAGSSPKSQVPLPSHASASPALHFHP